MGTLTYTPPLGDDVPDPSPQLLRELIFERGQVYYAAESRGWGGGGLRVHRETPTGIEVVDDQPSLEFFYLDPLGFFCRYIDDTEMFVPYDGSDCDHPATWQYGGDPMPVPAACCVPRDVAWEIVSEFCRTKRRSPVVNWVDWCDVPIDWEAWRPA